MSSEKSEGKWWPDPAGRADERWWDGEGWTDQVRDGTVSYRDPQMADGEAASWRPPMSLRRRWLRAAGIVGAGVVAVAAAVAYSGRGASEPAPPPRRPTPSRPPRERRRKHPEWGPVVEIGPDGKVLSEKPPFSREELNKVLYPDGVRPARGPYRREILTPMRD